MRAIHMINTLASTACAGGTVFKEVCVFQRSSAAEERLRQGEQDTKEKQTADFSEIVRVQELERFKRCFVAFRLHKPRVAGHNGVC